MRIWHPCLLAKASIRLQDIANSAPAFQLSEMQPVVERPVASCKGKLCYCLLWAWTIQTTSDVHYILRLQKCWNCLTISLRILELLKAMDWLLSKHGIDAPDVPSAEHAFSVTRLQGPLHLDSEDCFRGYLFFYEMGTLSAGQPSFTVF